MKARICVLLALVGLLASPGLTSCKSQSIENGGSGGSGARKVPGANQNTNTNTNQSGNSGPSPAAALTSSVTRDYSNKPLLGPNDFGGVFCTTCGTASQLSGTSGKSHIQGKVPPGRQGNCPNGMTACSSVNGASNDCCASNENCMQYGNDKAGCMPKDPSACEAPKVFCPSTPLKSGDTACCDPATESCETYSGPGSGGGVAYCQAKDCKKPNFKCGVKCCSKDDECKDRACSKKSCKPGETECSGTFTICCKEGEVCSAGNGGNPNCYPTPKPTPTPTPGPTPEPSPSPTHSETPEPSTPPRPTPRGTPRPTPEPTSGPTPEPSPSGSPHPSPSSSRH